MYDICNIYYMHFYIYISIYLYISINVYYMCIYTSRSIRVPKDTYNTVWKRALHKYAFIHMCKALF